VKVVNGIPIVEKNRFSKFCRKASELVDWKASFASDGINSEIVLTDWGFALYRNGLVDSPFDDDDDDED
jgi:hypothetical protein